MENGKQRYHVRLYGVVTGLVMLALQHGIYLLAHGIALLIGIPPVNPKIPAIDDAIPVVAVFIVPYVWAYAYWAMAPMAVSRCETEHFLDHLASYLLACLIGALWLILMPTCMDRVAEGLMDYSGSGFFGKLMQFWYSLDGGPAAYNLLPSFHCINSAIALFGVWGRKEIPRWYQIYSLLLTLLICAATLFVKQHYFLDVPTGILVAAVAYFLAKKFRLGRIFNGAAEKYRQWEAARRAQ